MRYAEIQLSESIPYILNNDNNILLELQVSCNLPENCDRIVDQLNHRVNLFQAAQSLWNKGFAILIF